MAKCPHHDDLQADVREVRADVREVNRKLDALTIHLIPQRVNGTGTSVSVQATGQQAAQPSQPGADWTRMWVSILMLGLVVVGGWLASIGFTVPSQQTAQTQAR